MTSSKKNGLWMPIFRLPGKPWLPTQPCFWEIFPEPAEAAIMASRRIIFMLRDGGMSRRAAEVVVQPAVEIAQVGATVGGVVIPRTDQLYAEIMAAETFVPALQGSDGPESLAPDFYYAGSLSAEDYYGDDQKNPGDNTEDEITGHQDS